METGSKCSSEVNDVAMASVDGSIRRDDDYIQGVLFSDGSTRAELDECTVSLLLDPGDYEDKFHLRRALSAKLTQQSIDDSSGMRSRSRCRIIVETIINDRNALQGRAVYTVLDTERWLERKVDCPVFPSLSAC